MLREFIAVVSLAPAAFAQVSQEQAITPTPRPVSQIFGLDLGFDGTTIAVGAAFENQPANAAGAVYLFGRPAGSWTQTLRLHGPTPQAFDQFGTGVAIQGETLLVGAGGRAAGSVAGAGNLYVYQNSAGTWSLVDTILPSNPITGGHFGDPVAMCNDLAVVGGCLSAFPSAGGFADREAYIYERVAGAWVEQARVAAPTAYSNGFTMSAGISTDGRRIAIGGSRHLLNGQPIGAVYIYEKLAGVWQQTASITPTDLPVGAHFGQSVALYGDRLAVGAPQDVVDENTRAGSVYLYRYAAGAWHEVRKIVSPTPAMRDFFGVSVAMRNRTLLVGAYESEFPPFTRNGYACLYHITGDVLSSPMTLRASDGEPHDIFGWRTALHGDRAVVTAPFETVNAGAAYTFTGVSHPCPADIDEDGSVGLSDLASLLSHFGDGDPAQPADLNGDGAVDLTDLATLLALFGTACP
jgi:FG-GAP repeat